MATKVLSLRVPAELAEWADGYAKSRGVTRQALCEQALQSFRLDCETGVPELRAAARRQAALDVQDADVVGVGDCPKRPGSLGHVWRAPSEDSRRRCRFCDLPGRGDASRGEGGFFEDATAERSALFSLLRAPASSHGKAK